MDKSLLILLVLCLSTTAYSQTPDTLATSSVADTLAKADTVKLQDLYKDAIPSGPKKLILREATTQDGSSMMMDDNGNVWKAFTQDGLDVLMNVRYLNNYGKYYRVDLYLQNNTDSTVHYDFGNMRISTMDGPVKLFSNNKYYSRVHSRKVWKTVGVTAGTFFISLIVQMIIQSTDDDNDSLTADIASAFVDEAAIAFTMMYNHRQNENMQEIKRQNIGYLHDYDIPPYNAIEGHAYAKYAPKAKSVNLFIPVSGREYILSWDTTALENAGTD